MLTATVDLARNGFIRLGISVLLATPFPLDGFSQKLPSAPSQLLLKVKERVAEKPKKSSLEDLPKAIEAHKALLNKEKPAPDEIKRQTEKVETILT